MTYLYLGYMVNSALRAIDPSRMNPPLNPVLVVDELGLSKLEGYLNRVAVFGHDVETNVVPTYYNRKLRTLQFGDKNEQYVVDLLPFAGSPEQLFSQQGHYGKNLGSIKTVLEVIKPVLENHDITKVGANLQFEYMTLAWCLGVYSTGFFDLFLAEKVIYAGLVHYMASNFWGLEDIVARYTGLSMSKEYQTSFDLHSALTQGQIDYGALDVRLPCAVRPAQISVLEKNRLAQAAQIEFDAISAFGQMFLNGMPINKHKWIVRVQRDEQKLAAILGRLDSFFVPVVGSKYVTGDDIERRDALEEAWRDCPSKTLEDRKARAIARKQYMVLRQSISAREKLAGTCEGGALINYNGSKQLYEGLLRLGYHKRQLPDTSDDTLEKLSTNKKLTVEEAFKTDSTLSSLSVIDTIRLHRSIKKLIGTYGYNWVRGYDYVSSHGNPEPGYIDPDTNLIHSNINQLGAATGRTSSTVPNVQNIPADGYMRSCFEAPPGFVVLTLDFNGCELRILAELSGEPVWLEAFLKGWDVHSVSAALVYGKEWDDASESNCAFVAYKVKCACSVHKKLRDRIKVINFSIAYGKTAAGLSEDMGITVQEAQSILDRWMAAFPTVTAYLEKSGKDAGTYLCARTLAGRWRRWERPTWEKAKTLAEKDLKSGQVLTQELVRRKYTSMFRSIEREGKNASIQGTNAEIAKLAMYFIWLGARQYGILQINFVHDENVLICPKESASEAFEFVGNCMERAGAVLVKKIRMTYEGSIEQYWKK